MNSRQLLVSPLQITGFFLAGVLLSAVAAPGTAIAQNNTAFGTSALASNTLGIDNSAFGFAALFGNTSGFFNTASGAFSLVSNTGGFNNTADGYQALVLNTGGFSNTASGAFALFNNTAGNQNTADGVKALLNNSVGSGNTAVGRAALATNSTGSTNTACGARALFNSATGSSNIGIGHLAGANIVAGSHNIEIGGFGPSDESNTIRIGRIATQTATFIAGISSTPISGSAVEIDINGQLGVAMSSARYKRDIRDIGGASAGLLKLRPVTFRYKNDPTGTVQYGLVAEEVERVYPELVTRGTDGKVQTVRYLEFTALLLNEVQKLAQKVETKDAQIAAQQREIDALKQKDARLNALSERLAALEQQVHTGSANALGSLARK